MQWSIISYHLTLLHINIIHRYTDILQDQLLFHIFLPRLLSQYKLSSIANTLTKELVSTLRYAHKFVIFQYTTPKYLNYNLLYKSTCDGKNLNAISKDCFCYFQNIRTFSEGESKRKVPVHRAKLDRAACKSLG